MLQKMLQLLLIIHLHKIFQLTYSVKKKYVQFKETT